MDHSKTQENARFSKTSDYTQAQAAIIRNQLTIEERAPAGR